MTGLTRALRLPLHFARPDAQLAWVSVTWQTFLQVDSKEAPHVGRGPLTRGVQGAGCPALASASACAVLPGFCRQSSFGARRLLARTRKQVSPLPLLEVTHLSGQTGYKDAGRPRLLTLAGLACLQPVHG